MRKYIVLFLFAFSLTQLFADYDKNSLFEELKEKYGNLKSVSATIINKQDKVKGIMKAEKGNKYYVETDNRVLVSNGTTIWNYSKSEKKVIISSMSSYELSQSLDYIFFSFLNDFDPTELSVDETAYRLELIYNKKMNTMIDKLFLVIDKKTLLIRKIQMQSGYSLQTWDIKDLKLNPKLGKNTFEFKIPEGTEVVDLR